ncbi:MAG: pentapeptide repeat-containing protein [bacterium]
MADQKALAFLLRAIDKVNGSAEWFAFRKREPQSADLSQADLSQKNLKNYDFSRLNLSGAKLFNSDLSGADFTEANLSYADLQRANLANGFLTRANLAGTNLQGANLVDTNLEGASLQGTRLGGAYIVGAQLADALFDKVDLRGATLKFSNLSQTRLVSANVEEADLTQVQITEEMIPRLRHFETVIIRGEKEKPRKITPAGDDYSNLFLETDCYKILGVQPNASLEEIHAAYRTRVKEYHPDKVNNLGEKLKQVAQREFDRIQQAYKSLTQHRSRPALDLDLTSLSRKGASGPDSSKLTIADYLSLLEKDPNNDRLHYNLGLRYFERGLVQLAIQEYQRALEINPDNQSAAHNLKVAKLLQSLAS